MKKRSNCKMLLERAEAIWCGWATERLTLARKLIDAIEADVSKDYLLALGVGLSRACNTPEAANSLTFAAGHRDAET